MGIEYFLKERVLPTVGVGSLSLIISGMVVVGGGNYYRNQSISGFGQNLYGSGIVGMCGFLAGLFLGEHISERRRKRNDYEWNTLISQYEKSSKCRNCKYFNNDARTKEILPCAVHPHIKENCEDYTHEEQQ